MKADDPVAGALLQELAREVELQVGPDVAYALFVDWRDGQPPSYVSNADRREVVRGLLSWLALEAARAQATRGRAGVELPDDDLQRKAGHVASIFGDEDCDVVVVLFAADSTARWVSTMPRGRELVLAWVQNETRRS